MTEKQSGDLSTAQLRPTTVPVPMPLPLKFHRFELVTRETLVAPIPGRVCEVVRLTFALPPSIGLGFKPGLSEHVKIYAPWTRKAKSYSPISPPDRKGSFDLAVKLYPDGNYSRFLGALSIGDGVLMSGPYPHPRVSMIRSGGRFVCVVAYGIGITSALPLVRAELARGQAQRVTLIHANRHSEDVAFADEVQELSQKYKNSFRICMVFSRDDIDGAKKGRVTASLMEDVFEMNGEREIRFHVVGSKQMIKSTWNFFSEMGYPRGKYALLRKGLRGKRSRENDVNHGFI